MTRLSWYDGIEVAQDPDALLDWQLDLSNWLSGDRLISAEVDGDGMTVNGVLSTDDTITAWLSGGVAGERYRVRFRWTTEAGRKDDRTVVFVVGER